MQKLIYIPIHSFDKSPSFVFFYEGYDDWTKQNSTLDKLKLIIRSCDEQFVVYERKVIDEY